MPRENGGCKTKLWEEKKKGRPFQNETAPTCQFLWTAHLPFGPVGARPYTVQRIAIGARRNGAITAIRQDVTSSTSTFENWIESSTLQTRMLYDVPHVETTQKLAKLNLGTPTFNRGPGESSGTFALESIKGDELNAQLNSSRYALSMVMPMPVKRRRSDCEERGTLAMAEGGGVDDRG